MIKPLNIEVMRTSGGQGLPLPSYHTESASGMDLYAALNDSVLILPKEAAIIPCGIAIAIPDGFEGQVRPRSGLATRELLIIPNSPGTIDSDYRGEIKVSILNLGPTAATIVRGDRFAQLVISPVIRALLREVSSLPSTARGAGGFGHTDTN